MNLTDFQREELLKEIKTYYANNEDGLKNIFTLNQETFGVNFYGKITGSNFETRIINLVQELSKRNLLEPFHKIVRKDYSGFAKFLVNISFKIAVEELTNILKADFEIDKEILIKEYQIVRPNRQLGECRMPTNATELISGLSIPNPETTYSYLDKFVVFILEKELSLSFNLKHNLKLWAEKYINNYEELAKKIYQEEKECKFNPCLLIVITEEKNKYLVRGGLITNIEKYQRDLISEDDFKQLQLDKSDTDKELTGVEEIVRDLIQECINITDNLPQEIHFFLPYGLMNRPIDCGKCYEDEDEDETFGGEYKVIIRCSEGLRGKNPRIVAWQNKGRLLKSKLQELAQKVFVLGDTQPETKLQTELKKQRAIAVKITKVFNKQQPGELLWKSSVPLALWFRRQLQDINNQEILDSLLSDYCLQELPEQVKNQRFHAMYEECSESHVGSHLCLLWDDPNFLPPEPFLKETKLKE